jgi:hypothetical protein
VAGDLRELMSNPKADRLSRIRAAELHAGGFLGTAEDREAGVATLCDFADDGTTDHYGRVRAIHALVRLGRHDRRVASSVIWQAVPLCQASSGSAHARR